MKLTLHVWRQAGPAAPGRWCRTTRPTSARTCRSSRCSTCVNERLIERGRSSRSRSTTTAARGSAASCGLMINGVAHGPAKGTATCQLHMRSFRDGDVITIEPWRARGVPGGEGPGGGPARVRPDHRGGRVHLGAPPAARRTATRSRCPSGDADGAMDAAACIGCGACVAACPNGSASLFTAAKISHLGLLPQGQPERYRRALAMVRADGPRGLRQLHALRRVPGGVPEGDQHRHDHADEPRLPAGGRPAAGPGGRQRRHLIRGARARAVCNPPPRSSPLAESIQCPSLGAPVRSPSAWPPGPCRRSRNGSGGTPWGRRSHR